MNSPTITTGATGSSTMHRRQPLLQTTTTPPHKRAGEVAGRTVAECATVCCCFPCAMMHFLILAVYEVPTGLCRKMWRKNKQKKRLLNNNNKNKNECKCGHGGGVAGEEPENIDVGAGAGGKTVSAGSETEMWGRFSEGGFWRNTSQKKDH